VVNRADLVLNNQAAKQDLIQDIPHNPFGDHGAQRFIERIDVNGDDRTIHAGNVPDQAVPNFPVCASNQNNLLSHTALLCL